MRVLVACEFSGITREAFASRGHDAWSCDLRTSDLPGQHLREDALEVMSRGWDLMIAHPPCRFLSRAGAVWFERDPTRQAKREAAMAFFMRLYNAPIQRVCIENPVGYPYGAFRRPDQCVDPYQFGDPERKRTCFWLRGLPPLAVAPLFTSTPELPRPGPTHTSPSGKKRYFTDSQSSGSRARSRTFPGIASAMAEQWGTIAGYSVQR